MSKDWDFLEEYSPMPVVRLGHGQEPLHCDRDHDEDGAAETQPWQQLAINKMFHGRFSIFPSMHIYTDIDKKCEIMIMNMLYQDRSF